MYHVLNERVPYYNFDVLTKWWNEPVTQWRVLDHYINKIIGVHRLLHHLDIISKLYFTTLQSQLIKVQLQILSSF